MDPLAKTEPYLDQVMAGGQMAVDWRALDWLSVRCLELDRLGAGWAARGRWFADVGGETGTNGQ